MTSSKATPPKQIAHDHKWQTFIEFTLSSRSDSIQLATDLVVGTVQTLNWPAAHLEQLKLALAKAIQNTLERSQLNDSGVSLIIRVFIPEDGEVKQEAVWSGNKPKQHHLPARVAQQVRRSPARGWGFFLVQKQGDDPQTVTEESHHVIELYLYQESEQSRKYK